VLPEEDGLARLDHVVELVLRPACELVDQVAAATDPEEVHPVEQPRRAVHEVDVGLQRLANPRALDLDRNRVAVMERGAVDLADRRGSE
jgi:hypothetical protein